MGRFVRFLPRVLSFQQHQVGQQVLWSPEKKSTSDLLGGSYSQVPSCSNIRCSLQISISIVLTDVTVRIKTSAYNVPSPSWTTR